MNDASEAAGPEDGADENKLIARRRSKLDAARRAGRAFPNDFARRHTAAELAALHGGRGREELEERGGRSAVAGRLVRRRGPFAVLQDGSGRIQLYLDARQATAAAAREWEALDLGDIVGVEGAVFKTRTGELTVRVERLRLLAKALRPLPDKHRGLADAETRHRRRYLDLIVNEDSREVFVARSKIIRGIRRYFDELGFLEVETPMMQAVHGGAVARPFVTRHNALDRDMYLRVAPELYLKRLVVGGFEKVYELNRAFRNEGLSSRHNPEFTMLEFYQAYARDEDFMDLTEDLLRRLAEEVTGSAVVEWRGARCDFGRPFERMTVPEAIRRHGGAPAGVDFGSDAAVAALAGKLDVKVAPGASRGRTIMEIFEQKAEPRIERPTFVTGHPVEVSPLARRSEADPELTERFELVVGGRELANGFSELNDPEDQAERFAAQAGRRAEDDGEAMEYDEDYLTALEHGMPPTAGEGIGVDRLVMLLTGAASIRDVLLFPHMRPRHDG